MLDSWTFRLNVVASMVDENGERRRDLHRVAERES